MGRVRPILFNTGMVQAILAGRKTVTRRAVKYKYSNTEMMMRTDKYSTRLIEIQKDIEGETHGRNPDGGTWHKVLPYIEKDPPYRKGDILYVRETWGFLPCIGCREEGSCGRGPTIHEDREAVSEGCYLYRAGYRDPGRVTWNPSIHMPRAAARIWLEVKSVRVEKLRDMDAEDLKEEGFLEHSMDDLPSEYDRLAVKFSYEDAQKGFAKLWDHTIPKGQQGLYGWEADPWVWVIGFERCMKPEG